MTALQSYRDLEVWKKSIDWAGAIYRASNNWPQAERFGLTAQVRRAAVSVASNLAEGAARQSTREFLHFLGIAKGSLAEAETQLILAGRLDYLAADTLAELQARSVEIGKMLSGLTKSLQSRL